MGIFPFFFWVGFWGKKVLVSFQAPKVMRGPIGGDGSHGLLPWGLGTVLVPPACETKQREGAALLPDLHWCLQGMQMNCFRKTH